MSELARRRWVSLHSRTDAVPCCYRPPSMHAAATTAAGPAGVFVARFPAAGSLPRLTGGAAPALLVSRACSAFTRVAARMVAEPAKATRSSECFRRCRYLHHPLRLLPAGATVAGRHFYPLRVGAFHGTP